MTLNFPKLTAYQQDAYDWFGDPFESGKTMVIKSVRQSGKTFFIQVELTIMAMRHPRTLSVVYEPTLALSRQVFKTMVNAFDGSELVKNANAQLLELEFANGSTILFKSMEQVSRGLSVSGLCVLDESAYLDDEGIYAVLPLIAAHNAPLIVASTPFTTDGYFYDMYMLGLEENSKNIKTFDWSTHPEIGRFLTEERKEMYKQTMSRAKYTTEVLGQFLVNDGLLFQGIEKCLGDGEDTNVVYMGIDFGTGSDEDYTVLSVFNSNGEMLKIYRTNHLSPMQQVDWLCSLILDWASSHTIQTILAEYNSIGTVYIDAMKKKFVGKQITITNWVTSNKSKQELVTTLQIALENGNIKLLSDPTLIRELRQYQAVINQKTKVVTYNGYKCNDDCVIATMLAYYAYRKSFGKFEIMFG